MARRRRAALSGEFRQDAVKAGRDTPCAPLVERVSPPRAAVHIGSFDGRGTARPAIGEQVLAAVRHNHDRRVWHCRLCLLMPDHLHAVLAFPREPGMQTVIANWKKFVAVKFGVEWQRDFFDHRLRDHHELDEKTGYILMNPVRKGLCERAEDWVWIYRPDDRPR